MRSPHGVTFIEAFDEERRKSQMARVMAVMEDGDWRTLDELRADMQRGFPGNNDQIPAISARLREARWGREEKRAKPGGPTDMLHGRFVTRRRRSEMVKGLHEYRLVPVDEQAKAEGRALTPGEEAHLARISEIRQRTQGPQYSMEFQRHRGATAATAS